MFTPPRSPFKSYLKSTRVSAAVTSSFLALAGTQAFAEPPKSDEAWTLTFESNFDRPAAASDDGPLVIESFDQSAPLSDEARWEYRVGKIKSSFGTGENAFLSKDEKTGASVLVLRTSQVAGSKGEVPKDIRTGYIRTRNYPLTGPNGEMTFSQRYGYFEARMKLDSTSGQWAAFWLMPYKRVLCADGSGRDGTEIDIVEGFPRDPSARHNRNRTVNMAIHYDGYRKDHKTQNHNFPDKAQRKQFKAFRSSNFHTYGFLWTPTEYVWYVDGEPVYRINDPDVISQVPKYLKLSTEVAGWAGDLNKKKLPADSAVDWVRVWQTDKLAKGNPLQFEAEGASIKRSENTGIVFVDAGTPCKGVFVSASDAEPARLTLPVREDREIGQVIVRAMTPFGTGGSLDLYVDGFHQRGWQIADLDKALVLKSDYDKPISEAIELVWSGGVVIDHIYILPKDQVLP